MRDTGRKRAVPEEPVKNLVKIKAYFLGKEEVAIAEIVKKNPE